MFKAFLKNTLKNVAYILGTSFPSFYHLHLNVRPLFLGARTLCMKQTIAAVNPWRICCSTGARRSSPCWASSSLGWGRRDVGAKGNLVDMAMVAKNHHSLWPFSRYNLVITWLDIFYGIIHFINGFCSGHSCISWDVTILS